MLNSHIVPPPRCQQATATGATRRCEAGGENSPSMMHTCSMSAEYNSTQRVHSERGLDLHSSFPCQDATAAGVIRWDEIDTGFGEY